MIKVVIAALIALVLFRLLRFFFMKYWSKDLEVDVAFLQSELVEGETGRLREVITNRKRMALPMIKVAFQTARELVFEKKSGSTTTDQFYHNDIFGMSGGERVTRTLSFVPSRFGYYRINGLEVIGYDIFFTQKELLTIKVDQTLYVYPKPFHTEKFAFYLRQLNGEILTNKMAAEDPFEFRGIREYQPYDDMRSINWKATAKTGELKVTQKNPTSAKEMRIILNLEDEGIRRKEDQVCDCVRVAAGLAQHLIKMGMKTALYTNANDVISGKPAIVEANIGTGHMREICRQLARLDLKEKARPAEECFGELICEAAENMTCFISCNAYPEFTQMLKQYQSAGNEFVWYYLIRYGDLVEIDEQLMPHVKIIKI
ncbi:MAG: DUF58 domain-containing protein [Lachnospiraceae bacterium]|nr:DUF58 domain-containing protein [Lachnospiraceae bacterium]